MKYLGIGFMSALLAILFIVFFALMTGRAEGSDEGPPHFDCNGGVVSILGSDDSITYDAGDSVVEGVCLKAGNTQRHNQVYRNDGMIHSDDGKQKCYTIKGIGTSAVVVTREGMGRTCQGLSHIDVLRTTPEPTSTPTPIPTPSPSLQPNEAMAIAVEWFNNTYYESIPYPSECTALWVGTHWEISCVARAPYPCQLSCWYDITLCLFEATLTVTRCDQRPAVRRRSPRRCKSGIVIYLA
ncbi:hypothetical protein LCGC14_1780480, partial [marine sediment metagenome]